MKAEKSIFEKSYSAESNATKAVEKEYGINWSDIVELYQFDNKRWGVRPIALPVADDLDTELDSVDNLADEHETHTRKTKDMGQALSAHRKTYVKVLSHRGNISLDNGDDVASILRGMEPDQVCLVADLAKDMPLGTYSAKYAKLNVGQRRMNAGNVIRGTITSGTRTITDIIAFIGQVK